MKYKVAIVARAYITLSLMPWFDPETDKLMDIETTTTIIDTDTIENAKGLACDAFVEQLYEERGGGPLWIADAIECMPWRPYSDES